MATAAPSIPTPERRPIQWGTLILLAGIHVGGVVGAFWLAFHFDWRTLVFAIVLNFACSFAITAGYHRLFSHVSYSAPWPVRALWLIFGAASVQNSALVWCSRHRRHHSYCDTDEDPYDARRGFWWSHVAWVFHEDPRADDFSMSPDLQADPLVRWQHRLYLPLVFVFALGMPVAIASLWGDPWGGLFVAVFLRLVVQYHSTFAINSFAHMLGDKHWSDKGTARDSLVTAVITLGEGYHDFHHRFPVDYRNGVRPRDFDPTKWLIWTFSKLGLARGLKRMPPERLELARRRADSATATE